jgi:hypothetical protein
MWLLSWQIVGVYSIGFVCVLGDFRWWPFVVTVCCHIVVDSLSCLRLVGGA